MFPESQCVAFIFKRRQIMIYYHALHLEHAKLNFVVLVFAYQNALRKILHGLAIKVRVHFFALEKNRI